MRKINAKLFLTLLVGSICCTGVVFGVHHFQYGRIADSLLWQARRAEEQGQVKRQARYLQRYLEFNPKDLEEKAHLAQLWAGEAFADAPRERMKAVRILDDVLTREDDRPELRRLLVKVALELRQLKMARNHLERLLTRDFLQAPSAALDDKTDPQRGEVEGYTGQLLEAENQPAKARICYRNAVRHAPQIQTNYVRLAQLLRNNRKDFTPEQLEKNRQEADALLDALVRNNRLSHEAYLARWRYRRDHGLISLKDKAAEGQVLLKAAADDVAEALQRAPESVEVLMAAADLERLEAQAAFAAEGTPAEKQQRLIGHRDKALSYLNQGLKLHERGGKASLVDLTQFSLLWHKADLLLDDIERLDAVAGENPAAKSPPQRQTWIAEVTAVIEQMRKTRGEPAAADYLRARLLVQDRRWSEAVGLLEQVRPTLGSQPDLAKQINLYLGQCYEQLVEPGQMLNAYERLLEVEPNSIAAQLGVAQAEWSMGRLEKAADKYLLLAKNGQLSPKVWLDFVRLEIQRQAQEQRPRWDYVEELIGKAKEANPTSIDVPLLTAQLYLLSKQPSLKEARAVLEDAQTKKEWQDNVELWTARVYLELRGKNPGEARKVLDEARQKLGERVVLLRLAEARLVAAEHEKDPKDAEALLNRLADDLDQFKSDEDRTRLLSGLAEVQLSLDNVPAARAMWQRVAKMPSHKTDLTLHLMLFDLAVKSEDEEAMRQTLDDVKSIEGSKGLYHRYGEALRLIWQAKKAKEEEQRQQFLDQARSQLDRVQSIRATWPPLFLARAQVERLADRPDQAIENLRAAVWQYGERSPAVIRDLVELLASKERYDEADEALRLLRDPLLVNSDLGRIAADVAAHRKDMARAMKLLDQNRPAAGAKNYRELLWEGRLRAEASKNDEAEKLFREAVRLADQEPEPYLVLVQFLARQKRDQEIDAVLEETKKRLPADKLQLALGQLYEILGHNQSAQARYEQALQGNRQDAAVVRRVAGFYWNAGKLQEAEPLLRDLVAGRVNKPSSDDVNWARWHLALVLASGTDYGRFREAMDLVGLRLDANGQLVRDAERERNDSTETRRFQARVLASQGGHRLFRRRAVELLEALESTKALRPDDRFILAMLYEAEGSWLKAKNILHQLAQPREPAPRHLAYYVQTLIEHNELDEAEKMADKLEELEHQRASEENAFAAVELRARLLEVQDKGDAALKRLEKLIQRPKAQAEEVLLLLNSLRRQKKFAEAFERCARTWAEKKCKPEVIGGASVAVLRNMQNAGTPASREQILLIENHLKKAIEADPKSVVLMLHLAELYDQRGDWDQAEQMYRQVLRPENEPKNIVALNNLAWLLAQRSRDDAKKQEALERIETAINGIGRRADLIDTRGLVNLKLGKDSAALADFREAAADMPTPAHLFHLASIHAKMRDKTSAFKIFKQAQEQGLQASVLHPVEHEDFQRLKETLKVN
jgi:Tfp pilus assembly protein PilF